MEQLKALRVAIDKNIKTVETLQDEVKGGARELALVRTKLQEAKMWVGKVIEAGGSSLPTEYRDEYTGSVVPLPGGKEYPGKVGHEDQ